MINIAICDDDKSFLDMAEKIIIDYMEQIYPDYLIRTYQTGEDLLHDVLKDNKFDIIFLDGDMPDMDGVDTAMKLRKHDARMRIIFITAIIGYSLRGYHVGATRCVIKDASLRGALYESLDAAFSELNKMSHTKVFDFREGQHKIRIENLLYIESRLHILYFYCNDLEDITVYTMKDKLDHIETELSGILFMRIHKSFLVNMSHVICIERYNAVLDTKVTLPIAQTRYDKVRKEFLYMEGCM